MKNEIVEKRRRYHTRPLNDWLHDFDRGKEIVDAIVHDLNEILDANMQGIKKNLLYLYDFGLTHTPKSPYTHGTNNQYVTVELK